VVWMCSLLQLGRRPALEGLLASGGAKQGNVDGGAERTPIRP